MSSTFKTLKDFILNSAFYGFAWPFFYNDLEINYFNGDIKNEKIKSINDSIESFKLKETSLLSLDSFTSLFEKELLRKIVLLQQKCPKERIIFNSFLWKVSQIQQKSSN